MSERQPHFAYDRSGSVIVLAESGALSAWAGADEQPLFRVEEGFSAVATAAGEVLALSAGGRLARFDAGSGAPLGSVELGAPARGLAVARDGTAWVLAGDELVQVAAGQVARRLPAEGAQALALADDGSMLALGGPGGQVRLLEPSSVRVLGSAKIDGAVTELAWNVRGFFVAVASDRLWRVDPDGNTSALIKLAGRALSEIACSADGGLVAYLAGRELQAILLPAREVVARLTFERAVSGLAFGPDVWLGVGVEGGDACRVNLVSGELRRTQPHPGRPRAPLSLDSRIDQERIRKARSTANPSVDAVERKLAEKARPPAKRNLLWIFVALALASSLAAYFLFR